MPVVQVYANGSTGGVPGYRRRVPAVEDGSDEPQEGSETQREVGGERGAVSGWSADAARRQRRWLYGIDAERLSGFGYAITLTVGSRPESAEAWHSARRAWLKRVERRFSVVRSHWVIELTARGIPHFHWAVYFQKPLTDEDELTIVRQWLLVARSRGWSAALVSADLAPISGAIGWLQYLSKHAGRSVSHYQRQGLPPGWETSGRMWGHGGAWPEVEGERFELTMDEFHRVRAAVDLHLMDEAALAGDDDRLRYLKFRRDAGGDARRAEVLGFSDWVPAPVMMAILREHAPDAVEAAVDPGARAAAQESAWVEVSSAPGWTPDFVGAIRERMRARQAAEEGAEPDPKACE